jgi:hypothetical protein
MCNKFERYKNNRSNTKLNELSTALSIIDDEPEALALTGLMLIHYKAEVFAAPTDTDKLREAAQWF